MTGIVNDVTSAGDINGDGFGDLMISQTPIPEFDYGGSPPVDLTFAIETDDPKAPSTTAATEPTPTTAALDSDGAYAGYLVFGGAGLGSTGTVNVNDLDGTNGFGLSVPRSELLNNYYGEGGFYGLNGLEFGGITALGDVNGDGFDDVGMQRSVVTSTLVDPDGTAYSGDEYFQTDVENRAFIIFGSDGDGANPVFEAGFDPADGGPNVQEILWNTISFNSSSNGSFFGGLLDNVTVAGIGDINGDGFADVAVGNPNINSFGNDNPTIEDSTGRVSVYFGGPEGVDVDNIRDTDGNGESDGLNLDGTQAVGASNSADLIILKSDGIYDSFGAEIAGVGDVTGDGIDDFLISAARSDRFFPGPVLANFEGPGGSATGLPSVFLIFGQDFDSTTPQVIDLDDLDQTAVNATGYRFTSSVFAGFEGQQNNFGQSISAAGDVNGDGIGDFIIGSSGASGSSYQGGQSYIVFGGSAALEAADNADGTNDNVIDIANLDVDVDTGLLPIEVRIENAGFFSNFQSEGDSGPTIFSFTVVRDGNLSETVSFDFDVSGFGSRAADASDFVGGVLPSGNVTFGAGDATVQIDIPVQGDFVIESTEDFRVAISNATTDGSSPISITGGESFGRIFNDDNPVFFSVSNAFVVEGNDPGDARELVFTVSRFGETDFDASVDISFAPDTFRPADAADLDGGFPGTQTVSFTAGGPNSQTIALPIAEDVNIEPDERVRATLSNAQSADSPNGAQISDGTGIGTIQNDDFPPRILVEGGGFVSEGTGAGTTTITFQILRQGDTSGATEVTYDLNPLPNPGDFFAADSGDIAGSLPDFGTTVRFEDGESVKTVTVDVVRDAIIEPRESFELRITQVESFNGTTYDIFRAARTATILNDDGRPPIIPPGVEADVFGDPHIVTLDGLGYDFQATGEYILVETLDGATNPFQVQVRFEPLDGSDLVSTTTRMAVVVGGVTVEIDANADDPLIIGGVVPTAEQLALGAIDVDGNGTPDVFFDAALSEFTVVLNDQNEQLKIKNMDGALNVCVFLADTPTGNQGNVRGLMGDADGTGDTSDDLALRDGTVLSQPVAFDTLYGDYAASWNLDGSAADLTSLFSDGVTVARDPDFPIAVLTVDDLPADIREAAEAAVLAAQDPENPLDPAIFDAAVLDFALTGNPDFISGALGLAAEQTDEAEPADAPALPATVNVSAVDATITEGDAGSQDVFFTFSRFGITEGEVTVNFSIGGDIDGSDVSEATDFTGSVVFGDGETTQTIAVEVLGDLQTEGDEALTVTIDSAAGEDEGDVVLVAGASATTTILTDDFAPEAQDDEFSTNEDTRVSGDVFADNQVEDLADNSDADADGDDLSLVSITLSNGAVRAANGGLIILPSGAHLRINEDGSFDYDPFGFTVGLGNQNDTTFDQLGAGEVATETFSYLVTDGNGGSDTATVSINVQGVDDAPVAVIDEFIVDEDSSVSGNVIDGPISPDFDPEGGDLTVTRINGVLLADADEDSETAGTQVTIGDGGILTIFGNGDVSFDTNDAYEQLGDDLVSRLQSAVYTIEDEGGLSDTTSVRFSVRGVNDGPVAVDDEATGDEDTSIFIDVLANDSDVDSENIQIVSAVGSVDPSNGSVAQDVETGQLIYTPDDDFFGTDTFSYVISDGGLTSEATVTVTIEPVNDRPEANDDSFVTDEDTAINDNLILGGIGVATATPDFDIDGDSLEIVEVRDSNGTILQLTNGNVLPEGGQVSIGADGAFFYDPSFNGGLDRLGAGESEQVTLTYVLSDGELSDEATVEILVNGVNDAPEAVDQELETDEDTLLVIDPLANASDVDGDDLQVGEITAVVGGQAVIVDGAIEFTPDADFNGPASVTYEITDGSETIETTANITVNAVNDDPTAVNDADTIGESGNSFLNLLNNDSDGDGDTLSILDVNGVTAAGEAFTVTSAGGRTGAAFFVPVGAPLNFAFDTNGGFEDLARNESDTVTVSYTITDGSGGTSTAEVEITVNGENDGPEIVSDAAFSIVENSTEVGTVEAQDIDTSDTLEFSIIGGADESLFEIDAATGALNFVDAPDFENPVDAGGTPADNVYEVEVSVGDGAETDTQTISVTVENDPDDDGGDDPLVIEGTDGNDRLIGTGADEIFQALGGTVDILAGNGGSDTFEFGDETNNGVREFTYILDFGDDDFIDLNGAGFTELNVFGRTYLVIEGDGDIALLFNTPDFDETTQLL